MLKKTREAITDAGRTVATVATVAVAALIVAVVALAVALMGRVQHA